MSDAARLMDRIYGPQRHIYDLTRKFYLLGRDEAIAALTPPPNGRVLEIGCGTARNLIAVARRYPDATCFGIDISEAMLTTARRSIAKAGLGGRIIVAQGDAAAFDLTTLFGIRDVDRVLISYALSMIPPWQAVLRRAGGVLAPGGEMQIVDFGDQAELPAAFKRLLEAWLARFHVTPRTGLPQAIADLAVARDVETAVRSRYRGYALSACVRRC